MMIDRRAFVFAVGMFAMGIDAFVVVGMRRFTPDENLNNDRPALAKKAPKQSAAQNSSQSPAAPPPPVATAFLAARGGCAGGALRGAGRAGAGAGFAG